jgi:hypothetical protein
MAADVDMNYGNLDENSAGPTMNMPTPKEPKTPTGEPKPKPETDTLTNAATNE